MLRVGGGVAGDVHGEGSVGDAPGDADGEGVAGDALVDGAAGDDDGEAVAGCGSGCRSLCGWSLAGVERGPAPFLAVGLAGVVAGWLARQSCWRL